MRKIIFLVLAIFALVVAQAQKTINDPNVELRTVASFHAIVIMGGIDLYLSEGEEAVAVSAKDTKTRDRIKTEVKDGVLKIYSELRDGVRISIGKSPEMKAYVSYKTLEKLTASGGVDVIVDGTIQSKSLALKISGGVDFKGRVDVEDLKVEQSGGTDVVINGKAKNLYVEASGGSDFKGYELLTEVCYAVATGASDITITVSREFSAEASGASDVNWKGSAVIKKAEASGAGSVSHKS
jgi:hypothetical protein